MGVGGVWRSKEGVSTYRYVVEFLRVQIKILAKLKFHPRERKFIMRRGPRIQEGVRCGASHLATFEQLGHVEANSSTAGSSHVV
jgi:hypothetical protein